MLDTAVVTGVANPYASIESARSCIFIISMRYRWELAVSTRISRLVGTDLDLLMHCLFDIHTVLDHIIFTITRGLKMRAGHAEVLLVLLG